MKEGGGYVQGYPGVGGDYMAEGGGSYGHPQGAPFQHQGGAYHQQAAFQQQAGAFRGQGEAFHPYQGQGEFRGGQEEEPWQALACDTR